MVIYKARPYRHGALRGIGHMTICHDSLLWTRYKATMKGKSFLDCLISSPSFALHVWFYIPPPGMCLTHQNCWDPCPPGSPPAPWRGWRTLWAGSCGWGANKLTPGQSPRWGEPVARDDESELRCSPGCLKGRGWCSFIPSSLSSYGTICFVGIDY